MHLSNLERYEIQAEAFRRMTGHHRQSEEAMSKELIERLRADAESTDDIGLCADAAERIEELERERDTAWAQAHRLALELECLIMDTKDNAVVSKWWDSAFEAIEEYQSLKPGADEEAEAWAKMRKVGI